MKTEKLWTVVVGNIGTTYVGRERPARAEYDRARRDSSASYGRASGEPVTLLLGGEIVAEYEPDDAAGE